MLASHEELVVGTKVHESGRARLRRYVVTENVTATVPVSHEEVRVEREPVTDTDDTGAPPGLSEAEREVVLHEEQPVIEKRVMPSERVRLESETVAGEEQVHETVRHERIETDPNEEP